MDNLNGVNSCADSNEGRGSSSPPTPPKNHRNIGFQSISGPDHLKLTFCWQAVDDPLSLLFGYSFPPLKETKTTNKKKRCQSWTPSGKTFCIRACNRWAIHFKCLHLHQITQSMIALTLAFFYKGHSNSCQLHNTNNQSPTFEI